MHNRAPRASSNVRGGKDGFVFSFCFSFSVFSLLFFIHVDNDHLVDILSLIHILLQYEYQTLRININTLTTVMIDINGVLITIDDSGNTDTDTGTETSMAPEEPQETDENGTDNASHVSRIYTSLQLDGIIWRAVISFVPKGFLNLNENLIDQIKRFNKSPNHFIDVVIKLKIMIRHLNFLRTQKYKNMLMNNNSNVILSQHELIYLVKK